MILFQFAEKRLGGIDILVLNHYILQFGKWLGTPENVTNLHKTMDVNFYAYMMTATHALPALKKSKGSIIIMNSNSDEFSNSYIQKQSSGNQLNVKSDLLCTSILFMKHFKNKYAKLLHMTSITLDIFTMMLNFLWFVK